MPTYEYTQRWAKSSNVDDYKIKIVLEVVIWKSKSHWKSNDFKIIFKIILIYSLYSSNFDVFCLLTALAIMLDWLLPVG